MAVTACSVSAAQQGIVPGMPLAEAKALVASQWSVVRGQESEVRSQRSEGRGQSPEVRDHTSGDLWCDLRRLTPDSDS